MGESLVAHRPASLGYPATAKHRETLSETGWKVMAKAWGWPLWYVAAHSAQDFKQTNISLDTRKQSPVLCFKYFEGHCRIFALGQHYKSLFVCLMEYSIENQYLKKTLKKNILMEKDTVDLQVMSWKRGQNDCKSQRPGRTGAKQGLPETTESWHSCTHSGCGCLPKTYITSTTSNQHGEGWGADTGDPTPKWRRSKSWWLWGEGLFSLGVWDLAGGSHYSGRPHPCACGQHSFD